MATSILGKASVRLIAITGEFQKGMRRAQKTIAKFGDRIKSTVGRLFNFKSAIATLLGGAGIGLLIKKTIDEVDALAKAADNIGTTTQALRGLQLQANLSGVATEKLTKGLKRYLINIGDAVDGTGEAGDVLKDMGLSAKELAGLPLVESIARFADALEGLGTQAERANAMSKLLGRTGADLAVFFRDGSKGIREAAAMAEKFGTAITRIDANKIEQANDAMRLLRESFAGLRFGITTDIAPLLTGLFNAVQDVGNKFIDLRKFAQQAMFTIILSVSEAITLYTKFQLTLLDLQFTMLDLERGAAEFLGIDTSEIESAIDDVSSKWFDLSESMNRNGGVAQRWQDGLLKLIQDAEAAAKKLADELKLDFGTGGSVIESIKKAAKQKTGRIGFKSGKEIAFGGAASGAHSVVSKQTSLLEQIKDATQKMARSGGAALA